jgi:hypothetical protein
MLRRHSISQSIRPDSASAARVSAAPVEALMVGEAWTARAGDAARLKSIGVVMTAERSDHAVEPPSANRAGPDALAPVRPEEFGSTDCPETRMAGDNNNSSSNNKLR